MAVAKVTLNNNVIVDMTDATAAANKILSTYTAYLADGTKATGSFTALQAATGTITLASNFSLGNSSAQFPGLKLDFKPDFFMMAMTHDAWDDISTPSSAIFEIRIVKKTLTPPYRQASNISSDSFTLDHYTVLSYNTTTTTDTENGYVINGNGTMPSDSYQQKFYFDNDGYLYVAKYSTASIKFYAGTYRYFAFKI